MGCGCGKKKAAQQVTASAVKAPVVQGGKPSVWNGEPEKPGPSGG